MTLWYAPEIANTATTRNLTPPAISRFVEPECRSIPTIQYEFVGEDERQTIVLTQRDQEALVNALLDPPPPGDKLLEAWQRYKMLMNISP